MARLFLLPLCFPANNQLGHGGVQCGCQCGPCALCVSSPCQRPLRPLLALPPHPLLLGPFPP
jgi:hypothetical protein